MSLKGWMDVIKHQAQESRHRDDEQLKKLQLELGDAIVALRSIENEELVQRFRRFAGWGSHDPRQTIEMQKYVDAIERETLRRMK